MYAQHKLGKYDMNTKISVLVIIIGQIPQQECYTPIEFAKLTGIKYSTVVYKCKIGRLAARQGGPGCSWHIKASEIERLKKEASDFDTN